MFYKYRFIIITLLILSVTAGIAFTNLGKDFFLCYPANAAREPGGDPLAAYNGMIILTSTFATTGTVRNWDGSWSTPFSIPPNGVTTVVIDTSHWISTTETVERKALRIQSDRDISAYFLAYETPGSTNDMALIYPVPSLGSDYITMCWRDNIPTWPYGAFFDRGPTMFVVFAPYDGTTVTITPSVDTEGGHTAGVPFNVTLDSYECYQVLANSPSTTDLYDLTGSYITSDNPIGVISGNQIAIVPNEIVAADYLIEQMPPVVAWGRVYNAFPIEERNYWQEDALKILASEDGTNISIEDAGGTTNIVLNRGEDFEWNGQPCTPGSWLADGYCDGPTLDSPTRITADKPVLCGQFIMGTGICSRTDILGDFTDPLGDPAFMLIPAEEQYSKRYIFLTPSGYNNDYLNVAILSGHEGSITLDGGPPTYTGPWFNIPSTSFRGRRISLEPGGHVLEADTTMMIQMYGFDSNWASYAAVAGQNLNPINAEYSIIKYCLETPAYSGTQTTWRIVIIQNDGDPGTGLHVVDTLPPGFHLSASPFTIELFGTATRTSVVDPSPGDDILDWGVFDLNVGDSIVITFDADIDFGVVGLFDNAVGCVDDSGNGITNGGGHVGHQDDVQVLMPAEPAALAGDDTVICEGMSVTIGGYPAASGGVPPLSVSWTSDPPGFTSTEENPIVSPTVPTTYQLVVTDSLAQADTDWVFIDIAPAPFADIIVPDPCGLVTSCEFQEFEWIIVDTTVGVLEESTIVNVEGTEYYPGGELTTTTVGETTFVTFTPSTGWLHGDDVYGELVQAMNEAYCWTFVEPCTFTVDLEPPIITDTIPPNGDTLFEASPGISLTIEDDPAGVDPTSFDHITIYVDGVPVAGWTYTWSDPTLTINGLTFTSGDTVLICLDSLYDAPGYDYCPPNDTSFCWEFYIIMTEPEAWITEPIDLNTDGVSASACTCQPIIFYLHDELGIDESTIILTIDGTPITITDSRLTLIGDTLIFQPIAPCWSGSEGTHTYNLTASNIIGAPLSPPVAGDFVIDLSPPYFTAITPPPGSYVGASPTVSLNIYDDGLGLIDGDVYITIDGMPYTPPLAGLTWDGTTFEADLAALGLSYSDSDIIEFCLMGAHDNPDYCDSNSADTCWQLIVNLAAPIATVVDPLLGTISACEYQGVIWYVEASNGINYATGYVDDGTSVFDMTSSEMSFSPATATSGYYQFIPSVPWGVYDWLNICLYGVEDSMAHVMPDTVCADFRMDLVPPEIYGITPAPGSETPSTEPSIYFCLRDSVAQLDGDSVILTVDGMEYTFGSGWTTDDTCLTWNAVDWGVSFPEGDTITICVDAADTPDTCAANHLDTCWTLIMPPPSVHAHAGVDVTLCPGDSIQIGCSPTGYGGVEPYTYSWTSVPAGFTSSDPNPYVSPTVTTIYIVHVIDDAAVSTEDYDSITITVDFVPVTPPALVSPAGGALIPPSPTSTDLVWNIPGGTGSLVYDVIIDGAVVATDIAETTYAVDFPCGETHTWAIIAKNMCSSEYYYCTADTSGDSTYIWIDDPDTHYAVSADSGRIFHTYPCGGPVPTIIRPFDGAFTACDPESIIIQIDDTSGIVEATIELEVDGTSYATSHAFLRFIAPNTLIFSPGAGFWSDGDVVSVSLLHAENVYGVDLAMPLTFSFTVDYTPPIFSGLTPPAGGYAPGFVTTAGFHTEDVLSGVDSMLVCITVDGPGYYDTYCVGDPCVTWDDALGNFTLDLSCAGYDFTRGDTITFCAIAGDSPDYCDANIDTSCWTIFIIDCDLTLSIDIPDLILCGVNDSSFIIPATTSDGTPPYSYSWEPAGLFDDPAVEDGLVNIVGPGAQYFILTVTDSTGCAVRDSVFIGMSNPTAIAGSDITACPDGVASVGCDPILTGSVVPPVDTSWYDMEGSLVHTGWPFIYSPTETDSFELVITDSIGCTSIDSVIVFYEHEVPGPFSWHSPEPDDTVDIGIVELCWEMPSGTAPIYFDVIIDGTPVIEGITDTCYSVGPYPCGVTHFWYIESYNYCYPIDCAGIIDSIGVVTVGDSFAGGFDPPFHTEPCPTAIPVLLTPYDGACLSCEDQEIVIRIEQPDSGLPIVESSIILEVEGTEYYVDGTTLTWVNPDLTFIPPTMWMDGQEVNFCLTQAFDSDSNTVNDLPFCNNFYVDLSPPVPVVITPPLVDQTSSPSTFEFEVTDAGCGGVDGTGIVAMVGTSPGPYTLYTVDGTILTWSAPTLTFDATAAGESWVAGDSIVIEIIASDAPDTTFCPPNIDTTHFAWFFRDPNAPVPTIIRPDSGDFTACDPDSIVLEIIDPDGVVGTSIELIVNGSTYTTANTELTWNDPYLIFRPSPAWTDATVVNVSLTHVEDIYGNDISSSVDWSFTVDLSPPVADMTLPIPNGQTSDREQDIEIDVDEILSGVDIGNAVLIINGVTYTDADFTWSPDGHGGGIIVFQPESEGVSFVSGDTVDVHLEITDSPDWCDANIAEFDWLFYLEPEVTCAVLPNPFTPDGNEINDIAMFAYPNMMSKPATIVVFDVKNIEIWRSEAPVQTRFDEAVGRLWNGRDTEGRVVKSGLYLYVVMVDGEVICNGTVVLLR